MKTLLLTSLLCLLTSTPTLADFSRAKCNEVLTGNDVIQVNRQWEPSSRHCFISVTPRQVTDLKYRDYYFDNTGMLMVFNSYGVGPDSQKTATRIFYLFPVVDDYPDFSIEPNGDVIVKLVSGHEFRISGKDFSIVSLSDGRVQEKPLATNNKGGVEIQLTRGFWLDAGFKLGGTALDKPNNRSVFQSAGSSASCVLTNSLFLRYASDGNFYMKYEGDTFNQFINQKCPQLKIK